MNLFDKLYSVPGSSGRVSAMEGLRAYAVLIVFMVHYAGNLMSVFGQDLDRFDIFTNTNPTDLFFYYLHASHYGVDIFFLISGFLISGLVSKENFQFIPFLAHRIFRIYPALLVSLITYACYAALFSHTPFWPIGFLGNILLLNGIPGLDFPYINIVTWSLFFEFTFYLICPLLFMISKTNGTLSLVKLSLISILIVLPFILISDHYMRFLMFIVGIWLKMMPKGSLNNLLEKIPDPVVIGLYLASTTIFLFTHNWVIFIVIYALPAFLFVNSVTNGHGFLNKLFSLKILRYFGNISFSFYLYHLLALRITAAALTYFNITRFTEFAIGYFIGGLGIALLLSSVSFWLFERPYFSRKTQFDQMLQRLRPAPPQEAP